MFDYRFSQKNYRYINVQLKIKNIKKKRMSIFFSPDEPKEIDIHTGRMTRLSSRNSTRSSFSRAKSITISTKPRKLKVIPEIEELKHIRARYMKFIELFDNFSTKNGPNIGGRQLSLSFSLYKQAFESFVLHSAQYFNSFSKTRRVGRFSPLIEFATKLLKEWTTMVIIINKLAITVPIPHLQHIQDNFDALTTNIQAIASSLVSRTYYRDLVYSSSNQLKSDITRVYNMIFSCLSNPDIDVEDQTEIEQIRVEMVNLSRNINENFIGLIPSNITNTPENIRIKALLKAACGDIISLMEAGFVFKPEIKKLLNCMKGLDNATREMLDSLHIKYRLDVEPDGEEEDSETESSSSDEYERNIEVHENKPYYVEVPEARKPRCTSVLTKKPYRGLSGLKQLPEDSRRKAVTGSTEMFLRSHSTTQSFRKKADFSKSTPPRPLSQIDSFINTVGESLGLEINPVMPEEDKMRVIENAIKEKIHKPEKKSQDEKVEDQEKPKENEQKPDKKDENETQQNKKPTNKEGRKGRLSKKKERK